MKTDMHQNSLDTYKSIEANLSPARAKVFRVIESAGVLTRQDITDRSGIPISSVTGRVKEMLEMGVIVEGATVMSATGKPRALLMVAEKDEQGELF